MKYTTKLKLAALHQICDAQDRSTEYMIQYMQDMAKVNHDCVIAYMQFTDEQHIKLRDEVNDITQFFAQFAEMEEEILTEDEKEYLSHSQEPIEYQDERNLGAANLER